MWGVLWPHLILAFVSGSADPRSLDAPFVCLFWGEPGPIRWWPTNGHLTFVDKTFTLNVLPFLCLFLLSLRLLPPPAPVHGDILEIVRIALAMEARDIVSIAAAWAAWRSSWDICVDKCFTFQLYLWLFFSTKLSKYSFRNVSSWEIEDGVNMIWTLLELFTSNGQKIQFYDSCNKYHVAFATFFNCFHWFDYARILNAAYLPFSAALRVREHF